jgi:cytochrome c553
MRYALTAAMLLCAAAAPALAAPDAALIAHCQSCHGDGPGSKADAPRLNGLSADYLLKRLQDFSVPINQSPHAIDNMWSVVVDMPESAKRELVDYFAGLPPFKAALNGPAMGRDLYLKGMPQAVSACGTCHGVSAEGEGINPRLAGQKQEYLKMQLWAFNLVARIHGAMNVGALKMSSEQIDALAAYLAGK